MRSGQSKGSFFFLNSFYKKLCFILITLYTVCHWRELCEYLVMCLNLNIKSCQMLCKNCFHQENRKLHAMVWVMSFWCIRERWKSIMEWILHLVHLFVWLIIKFENFVDTLYAWFIPIWLKGFFSTDPVIRVTMVGN